VHLADSQQPYQDKVLALQFIASPLASAGDLFIQFQNLKQ
jgi:hypothetical protein